jgi:hypothetical protein
VAFFDEGSGDVDVDEDGFFILEQVFKGVLCLLTVEAAQFPGDDAPQSQA